MAIMPILNNLQPLNLFYVHNVHSMFQIKIDSFIFISFYTLANSKNKNSLSMDKIDSLCVNIERKDEKCVRVCEY